MDLFGPIFAMLMLALLLVDHSILSSRIKKIEREMERYEERERY